MKKQLVGLLGALSLVSCGPTSCVARGTLVWTPRGKRPIEDLIEQDTVWCVEPSTGERVASPITAVARATREVMRLGGDDFSLTCTTDHPLYDPLEKVWAAAGDWVLGQRSSLLLVPEDGTPPRVVTVSTREISAGVSEVIDLTVLHPLHNFVAAGVLVHNKSIRISCELQDGGRSFGGEGCTCQDGGAGFARCEPKDEGSVAPGVLVCTCS
ncbi:MAG: Hint domain-containing protein [Archangium sp.]|nr:Hint domain-containing protein [Archangium sp.]